MILEIWKPVLEYEDIYEVSNLGRVRRISQPISMNHNSFITREGLVLKHTICNAGYAKVSLVKDKKATSYSVHRLVAQAFIPNPENKAQVNHKDFNRLNNRLYNLEWTTAQENMQHRYENRTNTARRIQVFCKETNKTYASMSQCGKALNISQQLISRKINKDNYVFIKGYTLIQVD